MTSEEMKQMLERTHNDIDVFDFNGKNVPRIMLPDRRFDEIMAKMLPICKFKSGLIIIKVRINPRSM